MPVHAGSFTNHTKIQTRCLLIVLACFSTLSIGCAVNGTSNPAPDIAELTRLAERGDQQAALALGMRYRNGTGVKRDYKEALKWYRACADKDNPAGMDNVGFMHLRGWGVPEDFNIAAAYFKAGAAKNDGQALFNLGNCYFSGQGARQDYSQAVDAWRRSAKRDNHNAIWRLAVLHAAGEGVPRDPAKARALCQSIADKGHINGMLLLGELHARQNRKKLAHHWWKRAGTLGSTQAQALLELSKWRNKPPVAGNRAYVEVDHLYQGWNNCGATSIAMFARQAGSKATPYDIKRLCPRSPIGTGTDWEDLIAAGAKSGQNWNLVSFSNDDKGFSEGIKIIGANLDAGRPVVIDFTVMVNKDGRIRSFGHTLLVVGYNTALNQFVLKNPNQPSPGIQLISAEELKKRWYSRWYSRLSKGRVARPLIVKTAD